jgi:hypothetical protein
VYGGAITCDLPDAGTADAQVCGEATVEMGLSREGPPCTRAGASSRSSGSSPKVQHASILDVGQWEGEGGPRFRGGKSGARRALGKVRRYRTWSVMGTNLGHTFKSDLSRSH